MCVVAHMAKRRTTHGVIALALAFLCSCATTAPTVDPAPAPAPSPPAVPAARFVVTNPERIEADGWVGSYEGSADIYLAEEESWQRGVPIVLFVRRDGTQIRVVGQMELAASRHSFYLGEVETNDESMLSGEYADGDNRYAYSLVRSADLLKGFVKMHQRVESSDEWVPSDEWHVDVQRRALTDLR